MMPWGSAAYECQRLKRLGSLERIVIETSVDCIHRREDTRTIGNYEESERGNEE
jgi:hypothetical protein